MFFLQEKIAKWNGATVSTQALGDTFILIKMFFQFMSKEFERLYREDQKHIKKWAGHYTDKEFYRINQELQKKVQDLLDNNKAKKGRDFFISSMIFHHGFTLTSSKKAISYAEKSVEMGYKKGKWLIASATDRLLQLQGKQQKFGTQIIETKSGKIRMYKVDSKTTDKEREEYGLPTLKELKERLKPSAE